MSPSAHGVNWSLLLLRGLFYFSCWCADNISVKCKACLGHTHLMLSFEKHGFKTHFFRHELGSILSQTGLCTSKVKVVKTTTPSLRTPQWLQPPTVGLMIASLSEAATWSPAPRHNFTLGSLNFSSCGKWEKEVLALQYPLETKYSRQLYNKFFSVVVTIAGIDFGISCAWLYNNNNINNWH